MILIPSTSYIEGGSPLNVAVFVSPRMNSATGKISDPNGSSGQVIVISFLSLFLFSLSFLDSQPLFPLAGSLQSRAVDWQNIGHYGKDEGRTRSRSRAPFPSCPPHACQLFI